MLGGLQSTVSREGWRGLILACGFLAHSEFQAPDVFFALQVMTYCSGFSSACRSLRKVGRNVKMETFSASSCKILRSL